MKIPKMLLDVCPLEVSVYGASDENDRFSSASRSFSFHASLRFIAGAAGVSGTSEHLNILSGF